MVVKLPMFMEGKLKHRDEDSKLLRGKEVNEKQFREILEKKIQKKVNENSKKGEYQSKQLEKKGDLKRFNIQSGKNENDLKKENVKDDIVKNKFSKKGASKKKNISGKTLINRKKNKSKSKSKDILPLSVTENSIFINAGIKKSAKIDKLKSKNSNNLKIRLEKKVSKEGENKNFNNNRKNLKLNKANVGKLNIDNENKIGKSVKNGMFVLNKGNNDSIKSNVKNLINNKIEKSDQKFVNLKKQLKEFAIKENLNVVFTSPFNNNPEIKDLTLFISKELKTNLNLFQNQLFDIFNNIKIKNINGNYFVSMKLFPENLGKIDIYLKKIGNQIEGHIIVQSETIKSLIDGRIWEMKNIVSNGNVNNNNAFTNLNVVVDNSNDNNDNRQFNKMFQQQSVLTKNMDLKDLSKEESTTQITNINFVSAKYLGRKINYYL